MFVFYSCPTFLSVMDTVVQRQTPTTLFPVTFDSDMLFANDIPAKATKVEKLSIHELECKIAKVRNIPQFTWTESMCFPADKTDRNAWVDKSWAGGAFYKVDRVDLSKFVLCDMGELGFGLFSSRFIPRGEFLFFYSGEYRAIPDFTHNPASIITTSHSVRLNMRGNESISVDARMIGGAAGFMQHAPRVVSVHKQSMVCAVQNISMDVFSWRGVQYLGVFAVTNIESGQPLTWDYCDNSYWKNNQIGPTYFDLQGNILPPEKHSEIKKQITLGRPNHYVRCDPKNDPESEYSPVDYEKVKPLFSLISVLQTKHVELIYYALVSVKQSALYESLSDDQLNQLLQMRNEFADLFHDKTAKEVCYALHSDRVNEKTLKAGLADPNSAIYHLDAAVTERFGNGTPAKDSRKIEIRGYVSKIYHSGLTFYKNGVFDAAITQWKQAKKTYKKMDDKTNLLSCYWNLGNAYHKNNQSTKAIAKLMDGQRLAESLVGRKEKLKSPQEFKERIETIRGKP